MVADIFGANITQGPSLPAANRSAFVSTLLGNPALLRARMVAAIDTVRSKESLAFNPTLGWVDYQLFLAVFAPERELRLLGIEHSRQAGKCR